MSRRIEVAIEATPKKAFATAVDWPGWSRAGKTPELALESLAAAAARYASVAKEASEPFPADTCAADFDVIEDAEGGSGTEFGVPSRVTGADRRPSDATEADRLRRLVTAAWATFDRVAAGAPAELRKGPPRRRPRPRQDGRPRHRVRLVLRPRDRDPREAARCG